MSYGVIRDRKGLVSKLKLMAEEHKKSYDASLEDGSRYLVLMSTIQMIEEIIYLNDCLLKDIETLFTENMISKRDEVPTMEFLEVEEVESEYFTGKSDEELLKEFLEKPKDEV